MLVDQKVYDIRIQTIAYAADTSSFFGGCVRNSFQINCGQQTRCPLPSPLSVLTETSAFLVLTVSTLFSWSARIPFGGRLFGGGRSEHAYSKCVDYDLESNPSNTPSYAKRPIQQDFQELSSATDAMRLRRGRSCKVRKFFCF